MINVTDCPCDYFTFRKILNSVRRRTDEDVLFYLVRLFKVAWQILKVTKNKNHYSLKDQIFDY
jgi:hypothetical protein